MHIIAAHHTHVIAAHNVLYQVGEGRFACSGITAHADEERFVIQFLQDHIADAILIKHKKKNSQTGLQQGEGDVQFIICKFKG